MTDRTRADLGELARLASDLAVPESIRQALRPFAEKWDIHAADEQRTLPARVIAEMLTAIERARAALTDTKPARQRT